MVSPIISVSLVPRSFEVKSASQKEPVVTALLYLTLNPFAPEYVAVSTPKFLPTSRLPFPQDQTAGPRKTAPVPKQGGNFTPSDSSSENALQRLADLLSQKSLQDLLPLPELETFRGDLLQYPFWLKSFQTIIESQTDKPSQRLYYLGKYTAGEAKGAISGFLSLETSDAYTQAKKVLADRFGNPFLIADAYRKKINEWPKIPPNEEANLQKYSDFLLHCQTTAKEIKYSKVLDDPDGNQKMTRKLPRHLIDRWSREVDRWLSREHEERGFDDRTNFMTANGAAYPPFSVFCEFLKREARIACNPVISSKILNEEEYKREDLEKTDKSGRYQRRRNCLASGSSEVKEDTERSKREDKPKKEVCHLCKGLHNLDACEQFPKMSLSERMQFVRSRGLCHGCLKWGHLHRDCRHKKSCSTCNSPHPTLLDNDALKKDTPGTTQEIPEVTSHRVKASDSKEHSECFSHSLIIPVWLCHEDNPQDN